MHHFLVKILLAFWLLATPLALAKTVFKQSNGPEPQTLDPHLMTGDVEAHVIMAEFEGLLTYDPKTADLLPGVAETWEVSPNGLTYTFHLRKNSKWSNGDPVTAHDFVYSWNRYLSPALGSEYAFLLHHVVNAQAFNEGKITDFSQVGVKASDDHTLVVTLAKPTPYFLNITQFPTTYPVHKATIEKFGGMNDRNTQWTKPENVVGNGPFKMVSWAPNDKIVLNKSETYWDKANVKLDEVELYALDNILTEEKMFRSNMIDKTYDFPHEKVETYKKESPELLLMNLKLATYFLWLNVKAKPLDDVNVRLALYYAVDRQAITQYVTKTNKPAYTFIPPGTGGFKTKITANLDVAKAKEFLAKAGYPNGVGFPKLQYLYNTSENHRKIAEALQQMWKKNLNIDVELFNQDWKVYLDTLNTKNFQIARATWSGDYNDPNTFLEQLLTTSGTNRGNYASPDYDNIVLASQSTLDPLLRTALFDKAEAMIFADMPILPIYFLERPVAISPKVKGWYDNLIDLHPLKFISIEGANP